MELNTEKKPNQRLVKILLADDHTGIRETIAKILREIPTFEIVAEVENGVDAMEKIESHFPDVILMDINMPKLNGIEATRLIRRKFPKVQIIGLSADDCTDIQFIMKKAGAFKLFDKTVDPHELIDAIYDSLE